MKQRKREEVEIRQSKRNPGENHRQHRRKRRDEEPRADDNIEGADVPRNQKPTDYHEENSTPEEGPTTDGESSESPA